MSFLDNDTGFMSSATVADPIIPGDGTQNITGALTVSGNITSTAGNLAVTAGTVTAYSDTASTHTLGKAKVVAGTGGEVDWMMLGHVDCTGYTNASFLADGTGNTCVNANTSKRINLQINGNTQFYIDGNASNVFRPGATGESGQRMILAAPDVAIADGTLSASQCSFYANEAGNTLVVKVKYADGSTVKTGTIALT